MPQKSCFVISPIGESKSAIREHADDLFDYIIKPACEAADFVPQRADHDTRSGIITEQMYDCILGDDLLIAVLTFHNPNVFYEVAIAEAAARPIILMIEEGTSIPFDIKDRRVLTYDLKPRSVMDGLHQKRLTQAIKDLQLQNAKSEQRVPFRPNISPLGAARTTSRVLRRTNELDPRERARLVSEAKEYLKFKGIAFFAVPMKDQFLDSVRDAVSRGVKIQVLLMDPENDVLEHQLRDYSSKYFQSIRNEVSSGIEMWSSVLGGHGEIRVQSKGFMTGLTQMNESEALLTHYSISSPTADSPCMTVRASDPHFENERLEFDFVWSSLSRSAADVV